jgi:3-methyladenine DNA glycosylase AlkD
MIEDIITTLRSLASDERKSKSSTYHPTKLEVLGVTNPEVKLVVKELHVSMRGCSKEEYMNLCKDLVQSNIMECQLAAWWLLEKEKKIIPSLSIQEMSSIQGILDNWVSVDFFGTFLYGVLWRIGTVSDSQVNILLSSPDVWQRRLALVGTVALNTRSRGGTGDSARTIGICEQVVDEREDMIEKALSWSLRSLIYWDKPAVESFMRKHDSRLCSRVKREVNHKLEHGTKN